MLRGLWLAVAAMGGLVQAALHALMPPAADHAAILFATALAAAVLYAVGAAAITFSVEHEEETYGFLLGLPTTWGPLFAGKLFVSALSAVLLAAVLTGVGWALDDFGPIGGRDRLVILGMLGTAILEGLAWGMLFSLLVKRPLVAAILALVVCAAAVNVIVNSSSTYNMGSIVPRAYLEAVPLRLAIVGVVLAASMAVARRWLTIGARPARSTFGRVADASLAAWTRMPGPRGGRSRVVARLLWQSWRESWRWLPLPVGITLVVYLAVAAIVGLLSPHTELSAVLVVSTLLFVPALYGALAFSADKRRGQYRFLAEHAGRPRYVWLARHFIWLGALAVVLIALTVLLWSGMVLGMRHEATQHLNRFFLEWGPRLDFPQLAYSNYLGASYAILGAGLGWCAALTAYAVGQFCSMLLRSEILAAFLALLLSSVLSAWAALLYAWQLSGWLFLLPLAGGFLLATWFRAPDWITGRNAWRSWAAPALAVVAPLAVVGALLPIARLTQLPVTVTHMVDGRAQTLSVETAIAHEVAAHQQGDTPEARETADLYVKAAEALAAGPEENFMAHWERLGLTWTHGGRLEKEIPFDERNAFKEAERKQLAAKRASIADAVAAAIEISNRPTCRFDFDASMVAQIYDRRAYRRGEQSATSLYPLYEKLNQLRNDLLHAPQTERYLVDEADESFTPASAAHSPWERAAAALRMTAHFRSGQPSVVFIDQLRAEQEVLRFIGRWAQAEDRTVGELRDSLEQLQSHFRTPPMLDDALVADHLDVRAVLNEKEISLALAERSGSLQAHFAYLADQLPWERDRAQRALNLISLHNLSDAGQLASFLDRLRPHDSGVTVLRRWLRPLHYWGNLPESWRIAERAAATSYLTSFEYSARVPVQELYRAYCNHLAFQRATVLQLALAMYRLDHGEYPSTLSALVPDYLNHVPLDPYSSQPFQYEPHGLDLPIRGFYSFDYSRYNAGVEPNTPFLWSVGAGNARLQRRDTTREAEGQTDPSGEPKQIEEPIYVLASDEQPWWNEPALVFPLAE